MDDSFHSPESREKAESKRAADEFALAAAKDQVKLALIAAKKKAEAEGITFDEEEFVANLTSSRRKAKEEFRTALQDSKNRVRPEDRARLSASAVAKDQARLSKIMAIRRAEADNEPIPNEDLAVAVGEELKKKKLLEASQSLKNNKSITKKEVSATLVAKDQARLAQIAVTRQIELEEEEIKVKKNKIKEDEERKQALAEEAAKRKLAKQAELELKTRSALKDQMRLSIIAAKRKAEEEGLPFNEAEYTINLVMAKRKQFEDERQSPGKLHKDAAESLLQSLNATGNKSHLLSPSSIPSSPERGTFSSPSGSLPSSPLTTHSITSNSPSTPITPNTNSVPADNTVTTPAEDSYSNNEGVEDDSNTNDATATSTSVMGAESSTTLAERQAKVLINKENKKVEDQKESDVRFADVMKVNEQAEETRIMMMKLNQRKIEQESQEKDRLEREKKRRERARMEERERQASFELMNKTAEQTKLDVAATQKRLEQPSPAALAKQEERRRLIANAKAKAAQEKKLRSEALHSTTTTVSSSNNTTTIGKVVLSSPNRNKPSPGNKELEEVLPIKVTKSEDSISFQGKSSYASSSSSSTVSVTTTTSSGSTTSSPTSPKRSATGVSNGTKLVSPTSPNTTASSSNTVKPQTTSSSPSHLGLPKDFVKKAAILRAKQFPVIRRMDIEDEDDEAEEDAAKGSKSHSVKSSLKPAPASEESMLGEDVDDLDISAGVSCLSLGDGDKDSQDDNKEDDDEGDVNINQDDQDKEEGSAADVEETAEDDDGNDEDDQAATVTSEGNDAAEDEEEGVVKDEVDGDEEADTEAETETETANHHDEEEIGDAEDLEVVEEDESYRSRPSKSNLGFWESLFLCTSDSNARTNSNSNPSNELS